MDGGSLSALVGRLRQAARPDRTDPATDGELLRRWAADRDEAAFELLVWRHGRLVLGVCRRLLRSQQDIEDAFQATFLVLVKKAGGIARRQAVAAWLYTVAYRVALEARARRRPTTLEGAALDRLPGRDEPSPELGHVLDEEVRRLPEKYRLPFVLCHLQGLTNDQAAQQIGCPVGTVLSRLSRARERLRDRLTRRGVAPALGLAVSLAGVSQGLALQTTRAALSIAAVQATTGAIAPGVLVLMEGAMRGMFFAKVKASLTLVLAAALLGGTAAGYRVAGAQEGGGTGSGDGDLPPATKKLVEEEKKLLDDLDKAKQLEGMLKAKLKNVQDNLGKKPTNPPMRGGGGAGATGAGSSSGGMSGPAARAIDLDATDLIEQRKARVTVKEAELKAAENLKKEAARREAAMRTARSRIKGVVSDDDYYSGVVTVERYAAEEAVKQAELDEAKVLLRQAERRAASPSSLEKRVKQLEDDVAALKAQLKARPGTSGGGLGSDARPGR